MTSAVPPAPPLASPAPAAAGIPPAAPVQGDPLAGLRDWHLPDPVSWWPPAPGWWLLAGLAVLALAVAGLVWASRRRRSAAARAALADLAGLQARLASDGDRRAFAAGLSELLKRLALARYPRERVAGLCAEEWLKFLDSTGGEGAFAAGPGRHLAAAPYRSGAGLADLDAEGLAELARGWIRAQWLGRPGLRDPRQRVPGRPVLRRFPLGRVGQGRVS